MVKKWLFSMTILALTLSLALPTLAQESAVKGNLAGVVLDATGAVVPGARITITGSYGTRTMNTDQFGHFLFGTLTPGPYSVRVEAAGFKVAELKVVEVPTGATANLKLELQPGTVHEVVEVTAGAITIDTTTTAVSSNIPDTFFQNIPLGRGVQSLFYIGPGVATSGESVYNPSISGGSALENLYVADGVSINDQAYNGIGVVSALYGSLGTGINISFIKEVQVKSGSFEPQYGNATGGVVQIVTKSGGRDYHGAISLYAAPYQFGAQRVFPDDVHKNKVGKLFDVGSFEATGELGGYVPTMRNKLFFFASFDPTWNRDYWVAPLAAGIYNGGHTYNQRTNTYNWAGKLTFKLSEKHTIESSAFADPSHTSTGFPSETTFNRSNFNGASKWEYGTRNLVVRYNGTLTPTWLLNANVTWNHNVFTESPAFDIFQITNRTETAGLAGQRGTFVQDGFGLLQNHVGDTYAFGVDTTKVFHRLGEHTFTAGFNESFPNYDQTKRRSGGRFPVPTTNLAGGSYITCQPGEPCLTDGTHTVDYQFNLLLSKYVDPTGATVKPAAIETTPGATPTCTICPLYPVQGYATPKAVYLSQVRGEFGAGGLIVTEAKYKSAYINDSWSPERRVTFTFGIRWDQQHIAGQDVKYTFTDSWSPRIGVSIDPLGDRKTKLYANFGRYSFGLPLDAAVRSLSSEFDVLGMDFIPAISGTTVTPVVDAAHLLNKVQCGSVNCTSGSPSIFISGGGEFVIAGTRWSYEDEFVFGGEHEFKNGFIISARYLDRRLKRIIEDMSGSSPEGSLAGTSVPSFIGNPSPALDVTTNEKALTFPNGGTLPAACNGGFTLDPAEDASGNDFIPGSGLCLAQVGTAAAGNPAGLAAGTPLYGGEVIPDGIPDGFAKPSRIYQAVEIQVNKRFTKNWLMRASWTISKLFGNYQGAFRGDNGQIDPGISSLFDFTTGKYNLLGNQFTPGVLNTDRRHIINGYLTYVFDKYAVKGLTLGTGITLSSGTPLNNFGNHPVYNNAGEVPIGGRGALGRTPVHGQVDVHAEYPIKVTEKSKLKLIADFFNLGNQRTVLTINQFNALSRLPAGSNLDFQTPTSYMRPFYARFAVRWEF